MVRFVDENGISQKRVAPTQLGIGLAATSTIKAEKYK
jgi:hypothetical protein